MRLLYIANFRMPTEKAHGIQIAKMCEAFSLQGINVELIVPRRFNNIEDNIFFYYNIKNNFSVKKLPCLDLVRFGQIGFFLQTISFLVGTKLYLFLKKYDILYSREQLAGLFFKNIILEIHTLPKNVSLFHEIIWKRSKALVVLTNFIKNKLIAEDVIKDKILVSADGVDLERFDINISQTVARKKIGLPLDKKIIMYAGLFDEWKGYLVLLESSKFFQNDQVVLVMIGGTDDQLVNLKKQYPQVIFLGYKPYRDLPVNQKAADILVLPNSGHYDISKYFTSPLKLFTYMAAKRPIVATALPSIREVLNDDNAILVQADNAQSLSNGIKRILQNSKLADSIAKYAYNDVYKYAWNIRAKNILNFIK